MTKDYVEITLDLSNVQSADDGETTRYGGTYSLNGKVFRARGDDRSDSYHSEIEGAISDICTAKWPDKKEHFLDWDFLDQIKAAVEEIGMLPNESGRITVFRQGNSFTFRSDVW